MSSDSLVAPSAQTAGRGAETILAASLPDLQDTDQPLSQWLG